MSGEGELKPATGEDAAAGVTANSQDRFEPLKYEPPDPNAPKPKKEKAEGEESEVEDEGSGVPTYDKAKPLNDVLNEREPSSMRTSIESSAVKNR